VTFLLLLQVSKFTNQIRNTFFCVHFSKRCKQNVMSTHLNYHNYWGHYTWLSIYISKMKKYWKLWKNVLFFLHFSVFFIKNIWGYPYLKTHNFFSIENMLHFFFFKFWMLTCIWCFWYVDIEYLMKRKGKEKVGLLFS
jgi:hypothetical protein